MTRSTHARLTALALGAALAVAATAPAQAAPPQDAAARATLKMIGGVKFKANRFISDTVRFSRDVTEIDRNGRLTLVDRTGQGHTFSLVRRAQLPRNARQVDACFSRGPCGEFAVEHGAINPETGEEQEPDTLLVNKGAPGFNQPGDSVLTAPRRKTTVRITARRDQFFICAIHPWMQGKLDVE